MGALIELSLLPQTSDLSRDSELADGREVLGRHVAELERARLELRQQLLHLGCPAGQHLGHLRGRQFSGDWAWRRRTFRIA